MSTPAASSEPQSPPTTLSPFRTPVFRQVWLASMASNFGGLIQSVGASWLMLSIASSEHMVALVQASVTLPIMLLSLVSGAMADGLDRRRVMLAAQAFMLVVSVLLAICAWTGVITPWLLLLFTFLIGCGAAFNAPAWQASVGDMVPRRELSAAVSLNSMGFNIARSAGPALGGAIVAAFGAAAAFAVNAVSYVALIVVLARWKPKLQPSPLPREPLPLAIASGLRYAAMSPSIRAVLLRGFVFGIGASSVMALMPLIAKVLVGGGPLTYGVLLGAFGIGAVAGALSSAALRRRVATEHLVRCACIAFAVSAAVAGTGVSLAATIAALLLGGASWVLALSTFNVTVQLSVPRWVMARALSLYQMATFGGLAGGSWLWGEVAAAHGIGVALLAAPLVLLLCAALGLRWPMADAEDRNLAPLRDWRAPSTAVPVEASTGPVVVSIEYRIREADIGAFLATMAERKRIRRRDGAQQWRLLRDVADPMLWMERYKMPTWLEYIRHNNRITLDDASIPQRLRELHQGPNDPVVRRLLERETDVMPTLHPPEPRELREPLTDPTRAA